MVTPGEHLEFVSSVAFDARAASRPELRILIIEKLKDRPGLGLEVVPGIRELTLELAGVEIVIFFARRSQRISLMFLYQSLETDAINARRRAIAHQYKGGIR